MPCKQIQLLSQDFAQNVSQSRPRTITLDCRSFQHGKLSYFQYSLFSLQLNSLSPYQVLTESVI
jgi:hypothetical protein